MERVMFQALYFALLWFALTPYSLRNDISATPALITVDAGHPGAAISPQMYGIFFEDINFAADGGLYPELVKNRSFEFNDPLMGWHEIMAVDAKGIVPPKGELDIRTDDPQNATNPHYLRARVFDPGYGFFNTGFRGMGIQNGAEYRFSAFVRSSGTQSVRAVVTDADGHEIGSGRLEGFDGTWKHYETVIRATGSDQHARLDLYIDDKGSVDLDLVSLYPVDTWKRRPNGLRKDLVQLLYDMHPGFIRFPGGCIVEGRRLVNRYQWKTTVGDISQRKTIVNRWNDEFDQRPA
ncbi:MAG TPA: hypothetical protein VK670_14250, partial [Silvibacterium sp.]|nr:hypothetical protein [Silvibacterium sp.]